MSSITKPSNLFTAAALNAGCAGIIWCGHRHHVRSRALVCLRSMSHFAPAVLYENGVRIKAMFNRTEIPLERYTELEADRTPEGRVRWKSGMAV